MSSNYGGRLLVKNNTSSSLEWPFMAKVFVAFKNFDRIQYYGMEEREAEWTDGMKNDDKDTKGKSHKEMQPKMTLCREASNLAPFFIQNHESRSRVLEIGV